MHMEQIMSFYNHDIFTLKIKGSGEFVKKMVESLAEDFNEPKFGYNGELYDEYE